MNSRLIRVTFFATFCRFVGAEAQAQVCVRIDESQDTLTQNDRAAAVLLLNRQFAMAGEQVVADCPTPYLLAHIKLGNSITVTLSGPRGERQGTALGLDDLPALYNQMVRSLLTGRPMTGLAVIDRTNVTAAQATAQRVHSDSFTYARLGYGGIFGEQIYGTPSLGVRLSRRARQGCRRRLFSQRAGWPIGPLRVFQRWRCFAREAFGPIPA